jgi:hypothetical protein
MQTGAPKLFLLFETALYTSSDCECVLCPRLCPTTKNFELIWEYFDKDRPADRLGI